MKGHLLENWRLAFDFLPGVGAIIGPRWSGHYLINIKIARVFPIIVLEFLDF
jgi:hypothetical protein